VSFSYEEQQEKVLKNINFAAKQGTTTALIGSSGAGKSTVAKLIPRFWDVDSGSITIGGVDIRNIGNEELMNNISFVFQENFLFNISIMDNIRFGKPEASKEQVIEAAKIAQCHDFIMNLREGYETKVGGGGLKLSGGEKQRIAIARALLKDSPIVILDEATSAADPENEDKIQEGISKLIKNKTVIVIAHRLSTIVDSDNIILLNKGEISSQGTHEELLKKSDMYKNMYSSYLEAYN
jgi:ABC-type multidrug transport system fused ATPase/permease subunit